MRKLIIRASAAASIASTPLFPAIAAPKKDLHCGISHSVCYRGCGQIGTQSDLGEQCRRTCDLDLWKCQDKEAKGGAKENRPQGGAGPKGGPVAKDPAPSKSGPSSGPPKSGTWHGPVSRPKSGPVWHGPASPPKSGPVWTGPATPSKGIGGIGPVLKSRGANK
jgi:hypothetical protein